MYVERQKGNIKHDWVSHNPSYSLVKETNGYSTNIK